MKLSITCAFIGVVILGACMGALFGNCAKEIPLAAPSAYPTYDGPAQMRGASESQHAPTLDIADGIELTAARMDALAKKIEAAQ